MFTRMASAKQEKTRPARCLLARADAALGPQGGRRQWIRSAIEELKDSDRLERIGVWLEPEPAINQSAGSLFRGEVWERDGGILPVEWARLSADAPLPQDVLSHGKSVEQELAGAQAGPMLGPLLGLARALWVPVTGSRSLLGLLLLGTREKRDTLPVAKAEQVAAELAWLLELEEERRLSSHGRADLTFISRMNTLLASEQSYQALLKEVADSCTAEENEGGVGAVFALIGRRESVLPLVPSATDEIERLRLTAQSGDQVWAHSMEDGSLGTLWRQAVKSGRVESVEAARLPLAKDISRFLAIPVRSRNQVCGILLAGISRQAHSLEASERLEIRAQLAAHVFERQRQTENELLVREGTAARRIFQSRMRQTEELASLGRRAIGVVHELGNPLTTILANAQRLVLRTPIAEKTPEARRIFEEAERATFILRQLLYLSRETQPLRQLVSLRQLAEKTVLLHKSALAGSPIKLRLEHDDTFPHVRGDYGQLQQVLLNLLQNAQQAIEQSGRGSVIRVRTSRPDESHVRLEVWDDGPGVSPPIQAKIFDPFFTTKAAGEGTGLGLSIALGFVRQHGGTMTLSSSSKGGARFVAELPIIAGSPGVLEDRDEPNLASTHQADRQGSAAASGGRLLQRMAARVLVVEDEPTVAALIADLLRDEGMSVDVLLDSRPALRQIEQESYDLLICDLKMPEIDGPTFYRTLMERRHPLRKNVLFVTGDVLAPSSREFLGQYHLPHLAKPFRMEELREEVLTMLTSLELRKNRNHTELDTRLDTRLADGNG